MHKFAYVICIKRSFKKKNEIIHRKQIKFFISDTADYENNKDEIFPIYDVLLAKMNDDVINDKLQL